MANQKIKFLGQIRNGQVVLKFRDYYLRYLRGFKDGQLVNVAVEELKRKRTSGQDDEKSNQNGYYWAVIIPILADELGYTPDEMHEALKVKFLRIGGTDELPKVGSTTRLSTGEWEDLMKKIRIWADSDLKIKIPEPNEAAYDN